MISRLCSQRLVHHESHDFDENFMDDIKPMKQELENSDPNINVNAPKFDVINAELNKNIEVDEVLTVIANAKTGKSFWHRYAAKWSVNANSVLLIHSLFKKCFESGILPDNWSESVIKPIPQNKSNGPMSKYGSHFVHGT